MNDLMEPKVSSTAATPQTEPEVLAAISSGGAHASEQAIRERAYAIWEEQGRPEGHHLVHWLQAEAEMKLLRT
jgi:hypothetical protein